MMKIWTPLCSNTLRTGSSALRIRRLEDFACCNRLAYKGIVIIQFLEQKKQKIFEVKSGIDEAKVLIRKIVLEARSLQPNVKAVVLAKLQEYKSDLNNIKSEVKKIVASNLNPSARDELLESSMVYVVTASADQRERLMASTERLNKPGDRIKDSKRIMFETEDLGVSILQDFHAQRQSLL
ncbi:vesicle transport v-SNARE 13-like [Arachis stenosperma]|uniref:vesicle transport v-SNARE 13-like n=1 Tax=Arachis stenosperma TaxID=217475 RepID=UPI0025AD5D81|nr:vesicle transport v-SNARE 13-like [Arachis stenosperma]